MENKTDNLLKNINKAIINFRGIYSAWSSKHGISYNEMLVLYTIRDEGFCTQKQVCDHYLLPRQTINNVISNMRKEGLLELSKEKSIGREKAFVLSEKGEIYAEPFLASLSEVENQAVEKLGSQKLVQLTKLLSEYDLELRRALEDEK